MSQVTIREKGAARGRIAVLALAAAVFSTLVLLVASAYGSKEGVDYFGGDGTTGGLFGGPSGIAVGGPRAIAVNSSGAGPAEPADVYIADDTNNRIQRFDKDGRFISAWGANVLTPAADEEQTLTVAATAGTYTLTFEGATTAPIPYNATAAALDNALDVLATIARDANVAVSGGPGDAGGTAPYTIRFNGALRATNVAQLSADATLLTGAATPATSAEGSGRYEICTRASKCTAGVPTGGANAADNAKNGSLISPQGVAVDGDTGNVYVSDLQIGGSNSSGNYRVNTYDGEGRFIRSFGFDVDADAAPTGYEVCEAAARCKFGLPGAGAGQLSGSGPRSTFNLAVSPPDGNPATGAVFLTDEGNSRVNTYNLDGSSPGSIGSAALFGSSQPRQVAVDSRGIVYVSNSSNGAQIERYDTLDANGNGVGFLAPITAADSTPAGPLPAGSSGATEGLAVDPDSDGAGPDADVLYVMRHPTGAPSAAQQFGPLNAPGLTAPPAEADDTHGAGLGLSRSEGVAVNEASGRLYTSSTAPLSALGLPRNLVFILDDAAGAPAVTLEDVTTKTGLGATLEATVDPGEGLVGPCEFQYSTDSTFTDGVTEVDEPDCLALRAGDGPQVMSEEIGGLDPDTKYFYRFEANRLFVPGAVTLTPTKSFFTDAIPPTVTDVGSTQVSDTSARMVATINPRGSATAYVFEYGTTPALGSQTAPLNIGAGLADVTVSQLVGGLDPDTDYFFRVAATNLSGTTQSSSATLHTRAEPVPPSNRGYEQVTPPEKNYTNVHNVIAHGESVAGTSPDGNQVGFCTTALFGDPPSQLTNLCAPYISRRTASGWQTGHPFPPFCKIDNFGGGYGNLQHIAISPDWGRYVIHQPESELCEHPLLDPSAPLRADPLGSPENLYLEDPSANSFSYQLLNTAVPHDFQVVQNQYAGGDDDFSHVVYVSSVNQTAPPDSPPASDVQKVYLRVEQGEDGCAQAGGCLSLLSKDPSGEPFATESGVPAFFEVYGGERYISSAISSDGERVYFQNPIVETSRQIWGLPICSQPILECDVYVREGGSSTVKVSESECTLGGACGSDGDDRNIFLYATPSGRHAFFYSPSRLTNASSPEVGSSQSKIYRWDAEAPPGSRLVDLTVDNEPSDGVQPGFNPPADGGFLGASDDGNTAFFVVDGQLVAGEETPPSSGGTHKLYRWRWNGGDPIVDYLGVYQDTSTTGIYDHNASGMRRMVTPDGRYLMLFSALRLDPAIDRDGDVDVYRWSGAGGWTCVSCQTPGAPSGGDVALEDVYLYGAESVYPTISSYEPRTLISDDGQRIFFGTPDPLVPGDVNGEGGCPDESAIFGGELYSCNDVYEWHDGTVSLVSSGIGTGLSRLINATPSGSDVFFYTAERLVGWDRDLNVDIYDARIGGGFPEPPPVPPACEGEACRGAGTSAPNAPGAGSGEFQGPENRASELPNTCGRFNKKAKRKLNVARKAAKRGQVKRARALRKQARNLNRRAKRCNRRQER